MNSRIRTRGLSAKEIVFQRDQVSNQGKPVDDEKIADIQFESRTKQHPTKEKILNEEDVKIGDNVFLKNDRNKLRGREMYKVIEVFSCNNEKWAKLLKSEKQLRKKTYDAKVSELFLVPGKAVEEQSKQTDNDESDADETPTENEKGSTNNTEEFDGQRKTVYLDHKNNPDHNAEAILPLTKKENVRKSAKKREKLP